MMNYKKKINRAFVASSFTFSIFLVASCQGGKSSDNSAPIIDDQNETQNCQANQSTCTPSLQLAAMKNIRSCIKSHIIENKINAFELVSSFDACLDQGTSAVAFATVMAGFARTNEDGSFILEDANESN